MGTRGNLDFDQVRDSARHGTGELFQMSDGTSTAGNVPVYDADGNLVDSGSGPGGSSGVTHTGTLTSGQLVKGNGGADITVGDLSGDVTTSGSTTTTLANIPNDTPMAGDLLATAVAAPSTPASGKGRVYVDSTSKNLAVKDDAGVVKHGVKSEAGASHNFLTAIADDGSVSKAQPAASDVSGLAASATTDTTNASNISSGTLPVAQLPAAATRSVVGITIDGGASPPTTGTKGIIQIPFACTITGWSIIADQSGSADVDICFHSGSAPPSAPSVPNTTSDKISASAPVALSSAQSAAGGASEISTWTTSLSQWGSVLFNLTSITTCQRITVLIEVTRT